MVTERPLPGLVRDALELNVKPEAVHLWVPFGVEPDAQALVVESVENVFQCGPVVSVVEVLVFCDTDRSIYGFVDRTLPVESGRCLWLSQIISSMLSSRGEEETILTMLVGGGGSPADLDLVQNPHLFCFPHSPFCPAGPPLPGFHNCLRSLLPRVYPFNWAR